MAEAAPDPIQAARLPIAARFETPVEGTSYNWIIKTALVLIDLAVLGGGVFVFSVEGDVPTHMEVFGWAALALIAVTTWDMWTGRTRIDRDGIHRKALFGKSVSWQEIRRVRFLRLPPSPRLLVSTSQGPFKVFYAGEPKLREAFVEIDGWFRGR